MLVAVIGVLARVVICIAAVFARIDTGLLQFGWLDGDTTPPTRCLFNVVVCLFALVMASPCLPGSTHGGVPGRIGAGRTGGVDRRLIVDVFNEPAGDGVTNGDISRGNTSYNN